MVPSWMSEKSDAHAAFVRGKHAGIALCLRVVEEEKAKLEESLAAKIDSMNILTKKLHDLNSEQDQLDERERQELG